MLAMIQAPYPDILLFADDNSLIAERCTERYLDFMNYINKFHAFFAKHVRGRNTAFDDIIHRFSFVFTIGLAQHCGIGDIAALHREAKTQKTAQDTQIWSPMLRIIRSMYEEFGLGWREKLLYSRDTWQAELRLSGKHHFVPRAYLFPDYHAKLSKLAEPEPEKTTKPWEESPSQPLPFPEVIAGRHPLLTNISEKVGEGRFALWFGNGLFHENLALKQVVWGLYAVLYLIYSM